MKKSLISIGVATVVISGCASTDHPKTLMDMEQRYQTASTDALAIQHASAPLKAAGQSVSEARAAWYDGNEEEMDHDLYLAEKYLGVVNHKVDIANMESQFEQADMARAKIALKSKEREIAALKKDLEEMGAKQSEEANVLTLGDVLFAFDDHRLQAGAHTTVERLADFLEQHDGMRVVVEGYTDSTGSEVYNETLSRKRAEAIETELADAGIASERIQIKAYGEANPIASNDTAAGRQNNRRVEVVLLSRNQSYQAPALASNQ